MLLLGLTFISFAISALPVIIGLSTAQWLGIFVTYMLLSGEDLPLIGQIFALLGGQDRRLGDPAFDRAFTVRCARPDRLPIPKRRWRIATNAVTSPDAVRDVPRPCHRT